MRHLFPSQLEAQRAILRLIHAYPLWTTGEIASEKWPQLVEKFAALYEVDLSPPARQWRKKKGQCCAHLVGAELPPDAAGRLRTRWVLLVTEHGEGEVKRRETLQDARKTRLVWGDYVLLYLTRPKQHGGGSRWTWCLTPEAEQREARYLHALAEACARQGDARRLLAYLEGSLLRRPLHSGVRSQIAKMLRRAQRLWARHVKDPKAHPWPGPDPARLPHLGPFRNLSKAKGE